VGRAVDDFVVRAVGAFVGRSVVGVVVLYQWCCGDVVIKVVEFVDSPSELDFLTRVKVTAKITAATNRKTRARTKRRYLQQ